MSPEVSKDVTLPKIKNLTTRQIFTGMVMIFWTISFLTDIINPKYDPPDYMNPLIMLVGGYLFATATNTKDKEKDG